jgi:uncharacterized protein YqgC (DUF456 family)
MSLNSFNLLIGPFLLYMIASLFFGFNCLIALSIGIGPVVVVSLYRDYLNAKNKGNP